MATQNKSTIIKMAGCRDEDYYYSDLDQTVVAYLSDDRILEEFVRPRRDVPGIANTVRRGGPMGGSLLCRSWFIKLTRSFLTMITSMSYRPAFNNRGGFEILNSLSYEKADDILTMRFNGIAVGRVNVSTFDTQLIGNKTFDELITVVFDLRGYTSAGRSLKGSVKDVEDVETEIKIERSSKGVFRTGFRVLSLFEKVSMMSDIKMFSLAARCGYSWPWVREEIKEIFEHKANKFDRINALDEGGEHYKQMALWTLSGYERKKYGTISDLAFLKADAMRFGLCIKPKHKSFQIVVQEIFDNFNEWGIPQPSLDELLNIGLDK